MLGYWGRPVKRRIVCWWFIWLGRRGNFPGSRMRGRRVSDNAVLKQNERFARELFPVGVFDGVMRDGG